MRTIRADISSSGAPELGARLRTYLIGTREAVPGRVELFFVEAILLRQMVAIRLPCPSRAFLRASAIQIDGSLTPFLYQTATIQQWIAPYAPRRTGRRHRSSQRAQILFEKPDDELDAASAARDPETETKSTISGREKRVFARLLDPTYDPQANLKTRSKSPSKLKKPVSKSRLAQGEHKFSDADLQAKHDQLLEARRKAAAPQERLAKLQAEQGLRTTYFEETKELREYRSTTLAKASEQFSRAKTDKELWQLLDQWAFSGIRKHFAQGPSTQQKEDEASTSGSPEADVAILTHNYPLLLVSFLEELRGNFPSSQLAFSLLPTVKSLGRQSYVLGASTPLYNGIILDTWRTFSDFPRINELLLEMENAGLEFDHETLEVLDKIRRQGERILRGERGELLKRVWELDSIMSGWTTVVGWMPKVKERLEVEALRRANESDESDIEDASLEEEWHDELTAMEEQPRHRTNDSPAGTTG
jgi:hypothetical protein